VKRHTEWALATSKAQRHCRLRLTFLFHVPRQDFYTQQYPSANLRGGGRMKRRRDHSDDKAQQLHRSRPVAFPQFIVFTTTKA
jgi:hypothetical protein